MTVPAITKIICVGGTLPAETKNYIKAIAGELGVAAADSGKPVELTRPDGSKVDDRCREGERGTCRIAGRI